jgi:hypothetical protein
MPQRLRRLDKLKEVGLTFVCIGDNGSEVRNASGRLEASSDVSLYGYRFRFQDDDGRKGHIGMIFPQGRNSQLGGDRVNRVYREKGKLVLEFSVGKCPGLNGCCQPWNNYLRYFAKAG